MHGYLWRLTLLASAYARYGSVCRLIRSTGVPEGTHFFTVNLLERRLDAFVRHIDARVVLLDHMHFVWTLPPADDDFSNRWKAIMI